MVNVVVHLTMRTYHQQGILEVVLCELAPGYLALLQENAEAMASKIVGELSPQRAY